MPVRDGVGVHFERVGGDERDGGERDDGELVGQIRRAGRRGRARRPARRNSIDRDVCGGYACSVPLSGFDARHASAPFAPARTSGGTKARTKNCLVVSITPEGRTAGGAALRTTAGLSRKCCQGGSRQQGTTAACSRERAYPVGENDDPPRAERAARRRVCKDALEHGRVELDDALREVVEALEVLGLLARRKSLELLQLALALSNSLVSVQQTGCRRRYAPRPPSSGAPAASAAPRSPRNCA